jgi:peptidoglycan/LPS O-acetylase OafA/YrhL
MQPWYKAAVKLLTIFMPVILLAAVIILAPRIGLGEEYQFVLYRWVGISRSDSLIYLLFASGIVLFYPTAAIVVATAKLQDTPPIKRRPGAHYRPDIDGLRAVAVTAVIINHFNPTWLPGGYLGVDVFFVISGFVILSSLLDERPPSLYGFLLSFYAKRVKRLVPALVLFVPTCALAICLVSPNPSYMLSTATASLFGVSNIQLLLQATDYFAPAAQYNAFTHTWSLGVEEQFYLIFPLIVYVFRFRLQATGLLAAVIATLAVGSCAYYVYLAQRDPVAAFFLMPSRFWELGAGALTCLALNSNRATSLVVPPAIPFAVLGAALFIPERHGVPATILMVAATAALIATSAPRSVAYRVLTIRPVLFIGAISYSLYLWHWGVLSISHWLVADSVWTLPLVAAVMVGLATLSYYYVEMPLRIAPWRHNWIIIVAGIYACGLAALFLMVLNGPQKERLATAATAINPLVFQPQPMNVALMPCHLPKVTDPIERCLRPVHRPKPAIFVIGDSHATNQVPSLVQAAAPHYEVRYLADWGFIMTLLGVPRCADHRNRPCLAQSFEKHLNFFQRELAPGDIVVFSWARDRTVDEGPLPRRRKDVALASLKAALIELRTVITSKGASLVFADDIPKPCNNTVNWQIIYATGRYQLCSTTVAISRLDRQPLTDLYKSLLTKRVYYFDPHDALCHDGICGIYDRASRSLIYSENSPHFPPTRPAPLAKQWAQFLDRLASRNPP